MLRLHVLLVMIMNVRLLGTSFSQTLSPSCLNVCFPVTTLPLRRAQELLLRLAIPTTLPRVPGASRPHAIGKVHAPNCSLTSTHRLPSAGVVLRALPPARLLAPPTSPRATALALAVRPTTAALEATGPMATPTAPLLAALAATATMLPRALGRSSPPAATGAPRLAMVLAQERVRNMCSRRSVEYAMSVSMRGRRRCRHLGLL